MSGRHGNQRKKKKTEQQPAPVVKETLCKEHPDRREEANVKETDHNRQDWRFGAATLFISILALVAAFAQAYIMRQAMRLDQRAWVAPQSLVIHPKSGEPIFAQAVIANSGKTFAFKVSTDFSLKFSHERLDIEKYVQSPARQAPKTIPSLGILAPNVPYTLNVTLDEIQPTIRTGPTFLGICLLLRPC